MASQTFPALVLNEDNRKVSHELKQLNVDDLPDGDVCVAVEYSTVNYKDGMVMNGIGRLVRDYPHVAGIDLAGEVEVSDDDRYKPGDKVVLTGWHVGERHWGGYAAKARVKADWLVPLPDGLSTRQAMAVGTAGFTSMLAIMALEECGLVLDTGPVVVTGAAGGVGSIAVAILANLGYSVTASTGRRSESGFLESLGASEIIDRTVLSETSGKPLDAERWAGAVDVVGSHTLANICASTRYGGTVTACGLAGGMELPAAVAPFILRGVTLVGIDSVMCPMSQRQAAWHRLATDLDLEKLEMMTHQIQLDHVIDFAKNGLSNQQPGKTVVQVQG